MVGWLFVSSRVLPPFFSAAPTRTDSVSESRCVMTMLTIECDRELPAFMRVAATGAAGGRGDREGMGTEMRGRERERKYEHTETGKSRERERRQTEREK